jgi:hypothetical protein
MHIGVSSIEEGGGPCPDGGQVRQQNGDIVYGCLRFPTMRLGGASTVHTELQGMYPTITIGAFYYRD